jgi:hypothetical protein
MRKLLIALLMAPSMAMSQVFVVPNKGGGEITITTRPCIVKGQNHSELREAYTWSPSSPYEKGCWTIIDGMVHILFLDTNNRRVYPIEEFQRKETR